MAFRIKVSSKVARTQNIFCDSTSYDNAQKLAEKIAEEQINSICQEFNVKKKDLKIDFEPNSYIKRKGEKMNSTKVMAFSEIVNWIKYKSFTKEDLAEILCAVDKECLKARGLTISELLSEGAKNNK